MESSRQIEDIAADWLARRDSPDWSSEDQAGLDVWLAQSFHHRVAYLRLEAVWGRTEKLRAFAVRGTQGERDRKPAAVPAPGEWQTSPFFAQRSAGEESILRGRNSRSKALWALAASVVFAVGAAALYTYTSSLSADRYSTPIGGTSLIPLADGTKVTLNTASEVRVALTREVRRVELQQGEAFFDVAKDSTRPFVVSAGDKQVTAVGTRFSVRRDATGDVRVTVTEGTVRFQGGEIVRSSGSPATPEAAKPVLLSAGTIARTEKGSLLVQKNAVQQAENSLSWRTGYLVFDNISLGDAVAEFNRYTRKQIRIEDPAVAAIRISGKFRADSSEIFLRLLRDGYAIEARPADGAVVLTSAP